MSGTQLVIMAVAMGLMSDGLGTGGDNRHTDCFGNGAYGGAGDSICRSDGTAGLLCDKPA